MVNLTFTQKESRHDRFHGDVRRDCRQETAQQDYERKKRHSQATAVRNLLAGKDRHSPKLDALISIQICRLKNTIVRICLAAILPENYRYT